MESRKNMNETRGKRPPPRNPIEVAITSWFGSYPQMQKSPVCLDELVAHSPKRWTVYEPMVLLPNSSFEASVWKEFLSCVHPVQVDALWSQILAGISKTSSTPLTHLAVNRGIPPALRHVSDKPCQENILRSPTGLRILHGDFGPASSQDFERTFWVSTRQNGVFQTWAPRWTMFSRGNIKEKARLLDFHTNRPLEGAATLDNSWAIDMYAGIGYFTFSYAKLGMRVLCWELNPWSVEGLRRGARGNGWSVKVVKEERDLSLPMRELVSGEERIVVFLEDNRHAARRMKDVRGLNILHVNCGLLPTSAASWKDAWKIALSGESKEAWLHLHENVGAADIERRREEIGKYFLDLAREERSPRVRADHTEQVKTFAPGVWHCVFDLFITRYGSRT
ncbi:S-adenosyl-L-methionine-dependent methyltransferase [Hypoxylon sp. NC1633]|nr:S-adenosyl-L-methionine-dependent methyltransferase [Hypoxylon sp. NC1633]